MTNNLNRQLDLVAELRLRQWARRNYVPSTQRRDEDWHSIVIDEMRRIDQDRSRADAAQAIVTSEGVQALEPSLHDGVRVDKPHADVRAPQIHMSVSVDSQKEVFTPYYV